MRDDDEAPPHDDEHDEPLGPMTPDDESPVGATPEVHDDISPHDIPKSNPMRREVIKRAGGEDETLRYPEGNLEHAEREGAPPNDGPANGLPGPSAETDRSDDDR